MISTVGSTIFPNITYAPTVSSEMKHIIEEVYNDCFKHLEMFQREIVIIPSDEHVFPDRVGVLYNNFGFLFYDPMRETYAMAFAMFEWMHMLGDTSFNNQNIYTHSIGFDVVIYSALYKMPDDYFKKMSDIPAFDVLEHVNIDEKQIKVLRRVGEMMYNKYDYRGLPKHTAEWVTDYLLQHMPPCSLNSMFNGKYHVTLAKKMGNYTKRVITKLERNVMSQLVVYGAVDSHFSMSVPAGRASYRVKVTVEYDTTVGMMFTLTR